MSQSGPKMHFYTPLGCKGYALTETEYREVMAEIIHYQWDEWIEGDTPGPCGNGWTYNQMAEMDPDNEEYDMVPFSEYWNSFAPCIIRRRIKPFK